MFYSLNSIYSSFFEEIVKFENFTHRTRAERLNSLLLYLSSFSGFHVGIVCEEWMVNPSWNVP